MTLSERNAFFKAGIIICAVCALFILAASFITIPLYGIHTPLNNNLSADEGNSASPEEEAAQSIEEEDSVPPEDKPRQPPNILFFITNSIIKNNFYAVHASMSLLAIFSLAGMLLIYYYFERTSAPEILYVAFFTISCAFEVIRLAVPLRLALNFPSVYTRAAMQILLFARFFGIFSLFAASVCSAGLEVQKIRNVVFIIIIAAMIITFGIPVDVLSWDAGFNLAYGYSSMFALIELAVFITTVIGFLITAKNKESMEYVYVAVGIVITLIGRNILLNTGSWIGTVPGILLLSSGTYVLCSKLHKIHLWM